MIQKIIILIAIALYFTGCSQDSFKGTVRVDCSTSELCERSGKGLYEVWSDGETTFDLTTAGEGYAFEISVSDSRIDCIMDGTITMDENKYDGLMVLSSSDVDCDIEFGGAFKLALLDNEYSPVSMLLLSGGFQVRDYELN